jgi:hypothetical protein
MTYAVIGYHRGKKDTYILKKTLYIAFCGEIASKEAMDLSLDKLNEMFCFCFCAVNVTDVRSGRITGEI